MRSTTTSFRRWESAGDGVGRGVGSAGRVVDEVYVGPRRRQRHTAELVAATYQEAGLPFPDVVVLPELDEYDLSGILLRLGPGTSRARRGICGAVAGARSG